MTSKLLGPYFFYDKQVKIWFDKEEHIYLREYEHIDDFVPQDGVTSVISIINKAEVLIPWASKKVYEKALNTIPIDESTILDPDPLTKSIPYSQLVNILEKAKKAPKEIKEDAGDVGSKAHNCLEDSIRHAIGVNKGTVLYTIYNPDDTRALSCVTAALDWMKKHNVRWQETERRIYSKKFRYCGTMDGLAFVSSCDDSVCCPNKFTDVLSLIDWKSSNGIWLEYGIQVSAYVWAFEEEMGVPVDNAFILRLGKEDGKFEPWYLNRDDIKENFQGFVQCLALTRTHRSLKDRMAGSKKARTARKRLTKS